MSNPLCPNRLRSISRPAANSESKVPSCGNQPAYIRLTRVDTTRSTPQEASSGQREAAAATTVAAAASPCPLDKPPPISELGSDPNDAQAPEIKLAINAFSRPVLRFAVRLRDDQPCTQVFVAHFKSKLPTQISDEAWFDRNTDLYKPHQKALGAGISTIRRTAEAVALRVLLTGVMPGSQTPVTVLGDINDGHTSNTANILTEQPRYLLGESAGGSDVGLYTAQTLQEYRDTRDVYYTHIHQDLRESLDQVLVSEQFYDSSRKRIWLFDGLVINNDHLNFDNHRDTGTSDHGVVKVTFAYDPA